MARKKKIEVEDDIPSVKETKTGKNTKFSKPTRETKRRKLNIVETNDMDQSELEPVSKHKDSLTKDKKTRKRNIKTNETTNQKKKTVNKDLTGDECKPIDKASSKKRISQAKSKNSPVIENEPKMKKARVLLKKLNIKQEKDNSENETGSLSSTDSGILSDQTLKDKKLIKSKPVIKVEIPGPSNDLDSSGIGNEATSSESEWEDVEEDEKQSLDDYNPVIPKEGVEITIDCPDLVKQKHKKTQCDVMDYIRLYINRMRKEAQMNIHKTHLLCLLAHGLYINDVLNSSILKGAALSLLPSDFVSLTSGKKIDKIDIDGIEKIAKWFRDTFSFETEKNTFMNISRDLTRYFESKKSLNASEYNLMFIVFARTLGFKTRLCISLYTISHKAQNLIKKSNNKKKGRKEVTPDSLKVKQETKNAEKELEANCTSDVKQEKERNCKPEEKKKAPKKKVQKSKKGDQKEANISRPRRSTGKNYKVSSDESDNDKDEDFKFEEDAEDFEKSKPLRKSSTRTSRQKSNRKILSSDSDSSSPKNTCNAPDKVVCWAEVFSKPDKEWISIECANNIVNKPYSIEENCPQPVTYILAIDNNSYIKDVTRRYCPEYMTSTIKLRADPEWWEETLLPFLPPNSKLNKDEEKSLETMLINKPLPHTVAGFKNHPLYALKRHLLKFEAIYPPDAATVGFIRGEPIYPRECVCQLHSRETWVKEARVVRIGEEPYKIVKARPKWDKIAGVLRTDLPLELFGFWQTKPYEPPTAVDGKVPRNEYGNVELFKPCMLPKGTVHLQLPGLNRIAKKLNIDCSSAVVGFDINKGGIHPVYDGFVICKEFKDTILAAWEEEQENIHKREVEKREKRIYGNWKKLIRGLLIRERLKIKYDVQ
ncbi:DNA repair protein complementing XP-C cells homolog [Nephila pilipes]|uniref:DNA repair protein complementing XP-C cells homolog n=1 Tax=Nephila pilipes TaxID=299642 RepID=A0A8X6TBY6_NEPPI|nr:DNA repair protein complementing XP-C cells homolog [Nephila pilipes]